MRRPERKYRLWPDAEKGPWLLVIHLTPVSGRVECVGVEIRSFRHPNELKAEPDWGQQALDLLPVWEDSFLASDDLEARQSGKAYGIVEVSQDGRVLSRSTPSSIVPLTSVGIRIPLAEIVADVRGSFVNAFEHMADDAESDERREELLERARLFAADKRKGRGRKGLPVEHFEEVAHVYRTAYMDAGSPTEAVKKHFGISHSAAAKKVARARNLGFLGPATHGRASL